MFVNRPEKVSEEAFLKCLLSWVNSGILIHDLESWETNIYIHNFHSWSIWYWLSILKSNCSFFVFHFYPRKNQNNMILLAEKTTTSPIFFLLNQLETNTFSCFNIIFKSLLTLNFQNCLDLSGSEKWQGLQTRKYKWYSHVFWKDWSTI